MKNRIHVLSFCFFFMTVSLCLAIQKPGDIQEELPPDGKAESRKSWKVPSFLGDVSVDKNLLPPDLVFKPIPDAERLQWIEKLELEQNRTLDKIDTCRLVYWDSFAEKNRHGFQGRKKGITKSGTKVFETLYSAAGSETKNLHYFLRRKFWEKYKANRENQEVAFDGSCFRLMRWELFGKNTRTVFDDIAGFGEGSATMKWWNQDPAFHLNPIFFGTNGSLSNLYKQFTSAINNPRKKLTLMKSDGVLFFEIHLKDTDWKQTWYFDLSKGGVLLYRKKFLSTTKHQFTKVNELWIPKSIESTDSKRKYTRRLLLESQVNAKLESSTFSLRDLVVYKPGKFGQSFLWDLRNGKKRYTFSQIKDLLSDQFQKEYLDPSAQSGIDRAAKRLKPKPSEDDLEKFDKTVQRHLERYPSKTVLQPGSVQFLNRSRFVADLKGTGKSISFFIIVRVPDEDSIPEGGVPEVFFDSEEGPSQPKIAITKVNVSEYNKVMKKQDENFFPILVHDYLEFYHVTISSKKELANKKATNRKDPTTAKIEFQYNSTGLEFPLIIRK